MASSRIDFVRGTTRTIEIPLVDDDGQAVPVDTLDGATAEFSLRVAPYSVVDTLHFASPSAGLAFKPNQAALVLSFAPADTEDLDLLVYVFQVKVTYANGDVKIPVDWSPFDLNLGGVANPAYPVFDETTALNHDYETTDSLRYMTPGGSPISNAQVRVYTQADYVARRLSTPVGVTTTKADGRWLHTILVKPGFTYVVQFTKPNEFGPDVATVVA